MTRARCVTGAVAAPRVHDQLVPPNSILGEPYRLPDEATVHAFEARGYRLEDQGCNGDLEAIEIAARGTFAVADPRGIGVGRVSPWSRTRCHDGAARVGARATVH